MNEQKKPEMPEVAALLKAVACQKDAERDVKIARDALSIAEKSERFMRKEIGAAVRALRGRLGISADTMSRRHFLSGSQALVDYMRFEDEGEGNSYTCKDIVDRLLKEARDADV